MQKRSRSRSPRRAENDTTPAVVDTPAVEAPQETNISQAQTEASKPPANPFTSDSTATVMQEFMEAAKVDAVGEVRVEKLALGPVVPSYSREAQAKLAERVGVMGIPEEVRQRLPPTMDILPQNAIPLNGSDAKPADPKMLAGIVGDVDNQPKRICETIMQIPEQCVDHVLGKHGETIQAAKQKVGDGVAIVMSKGARHVGSFTRCYIGADTQELLKKAEDEINNLVKQAMNAIEGTGDITEVGGKWACRKLKKIILHYSRERETECDMVNINIELFEL